MDGMEIQLPHNKYNSLCIRQHIAAKKRWQNKISDYRRVHKINYQLVSFSYLSYIYAILS